MNYFTPNKHLEKSLADAGKEKQLEQYNKVVNAANFIFVHHKPVYAKKIQGEFLTSGDPLRFLKASFKYAMERPELAVDLKDFLSKELR